MTMIRIHTRHLPRLLALLIALLATGCSEDFLNPGGETLIRGRVSLDPAVDPERGPVFGLGMGITYEVANAATAPGVTGAAVLRTQAVTLDPPFPNPMTLDGTVRLQVTEAVSARVEIWGTLDGLFTRLNLLRVGDLPAGTHRLFWDGRDGASGELLPNGLYTVRVSVPANPPQGTQPTVLEAPWLLNRGVLDAIALEAFNTYTDGDGFYVIYDVAVGETFARTNAEGVVQGNGIIRNRVRLFADDRDFQHYESNVDIAPGEVVITDVSLVPQIALAPAPATSFRDPAPAGPPVPHTP